MKEIAASTPSRSHNVKSTRKRERERERARFKHGGEEKIRFSREHRCFYTKNVRGKLLARLVSRGDRETGQLGRRDSNAWLIDRRNKIRRVGGYFSGNLRAGISR